MRLSLSPHIMNFLPLIESKREGKILAPKQIQEFIREFTAGHIPDYQMAAMLMAIYFRGLDTAETTARMASVSAVVSSVFRPRK